MIYEFVLCCVLFCFLRDDMEVLDEPPYATFLRATGVDRPYKEELLSKMESDGHKVVKDIIYGPGEKKYRFWKHMVKQRVTGLPDDLLKKAKHIILIQNPLDIMQSFGKFVRPSVKELGLTDLLAVYGELCELGKTPVIIDAADLRQDPEATLHGLCEDLDIPFQAAMMGSWSQTNRWLLGTMVVRKCTQIYGL
ncbi:branched-chain-amino-acid aminotransferase-like protein 2 [Pistacia vera]|uniref:branched-chain-amino-acid aminotransferase-like protein 2 n=1 Tax=Pistacia vera TaxID=55513 RepID=UPI0012633C7E|nr:branched-chain-amino-acid aminotransferase-like protein 2 [Pistacia vera]